MAAALRWRGCGCARASEREEAEERNKGEGESEGEVRGGRGGAWHHRSVQAEEEAGRQGGGGRGAWPRAPGACSSYWREEEGDREEEVGWATQCWTSTGAGPALVGCTGEPR